MRAWPGGGMCGGWRVAGGRRQLRTDVGLRREVHHRVDVLLLHDVVHQVRRRDGALAWGVGPTDGEATEAGAHGEEVRWGPHTGAMRATLVALGVRTVPCRRYGYGVPQSRPHPRATYVTTHLDELVVGRILDGSQVLEAGAVVQLVEVHDPVRRVLLDEVDHNMGAAAQHNGVAALHVRARGARRPRGSVRSHSDRSGHIHYSHAPPQLTRPRTLTNGCGKRSGGTDNATPQHEHQRT